MDESENTPSTFEGAVSLMPDSEDSIICEAYDKALRDTRSRIPDNLLHLVSNSEKEIKRNHLQAKIRLRNNAQGGIAMVNTISEDFYAVHEWPIYTIEILLSGDFTYSKRLALACFLVGNGLNDAELGIQIFKFYNHHWDAGQRWNRRFVEFRDLFTYLNKPIDDPDSARIRSTYFYYSMESKQTLFFNSESRLR